MTDIEILRLHYAKTLRIWQQRFHANKDIVIAKMGHKFYRMWDFYLTICEISFEYSDSVVFQIQLTKQHDIVPPTRDYLYTESNNESVIQTLKLVS